MMMNTTIISSVLNISNDLIQLNISSNLRLTRHLVHVIIFILFLSILAFIGYQHPYPQTSNRSLSYFSRFLVFCGIISLILNDLLIINGVTHQSWCYIHQIIFHFLLIIIVTSHLLPDLYHYIHRYYHQRDSGTLKFVVICIFISLLITQLIITIKWSWNHDSLETNSLNQPILCAGNVRPQLLIFILHILDFILIIQTICNPTLTDETNSISLITEKFCELNSILLRLFYFTGTSILQIFFLPGEFSGTFYGGILMIEYILKYLITIYQSNIRFERNMIGLNDKNNNIPYLRLQNDDLNDDTRLLNDID